jgi:hypothetical protein
VLLPALLASADVKVLHEGFVGALPQPISCHPSEPLLPACACGCLMLIFAMVCPACLVSPSSFLRSGYLVAGGYGRSTPQRLPGRCRMFLLRSSYLVVGALPRSGYLVAGGFRRLYFAATTWSLPDVPTAHRLPSRWRSTPQRLPGRWRFPSSLLRSDYLVACHHGLTHTWLATIVRMFFS